MPYVLGYSEPERQWSASAFARWCWRNQRPLGAVAGVLVATWAAWYWGRAPAAALKWRLAINAERRSFYRQALNYAPPATQPVFDESIDAGPIELAEHIPGFPPDQLVWRVSRQDPRYWMW